MQGVGLKSVGMLKSCQNDYQRCRLLTVARKVPESSMVRKNSVSTPAIFTKPAPTEQISTIAVKMKYKSRLTSVTLLHVRNFDDSLTVTRTGRETHVPIKYKVATRFPRRNNVPSSKHKRPVRWS